MDFGSVSNAVHNVNGSLIMRLDDETSYRLLKLLSKKPDMSQRQIAREAGISLGKINFCLHAFVERGWVKVKNFSRSRNKQVYAYYLTPAGVREKALISARFLKYKMKEYEALKKEIKRLKWEVEVENANFGGK